MSNVWQDGPPETVLVTLAATEAKLGHVCLLAMADGQVRINHCADPAAALRKAIAEAKRKPGAAILRAVLSVPHREQWKTEFQLHNRFAPLRSFGDYFRAPIDDVVAVLEELELTRD
jgi:hypothetical protein